MKPLSEKRTDLLLVDPKAIDIEPGFNVRIDYGDLNELANSIFENGIRTPFLLRRRKDAQDRFYVIEGHRRQAACDILFKDGRWTDDMEVRVRATLETKGNNEFDRLIDMAVTNTGKPFTPIEFALLVQRLRAYNKTDAEIGKRLGKSITTISNTTLLLELPEEVKKAISEKKLSANLAMAVVKEEKDSEKANAILKSALSKNEGDGSTESQRNQKKITMSSIAVQQGKHNSIKIFKKLSSNSDAKIMPKMENTFGIVKGILDGKLSEEELLGLFYK